MRFQLVMVERRLDRLAGQESIDETAKDKATIVKLEEASALVEADAEMLSGQLQISLQAAGEPEVDLHPSLTQFAHIGLLFSLERQSSSYLQDDVSAYI